MTNFNHRTKYIPTIYPVWWRLDTFCLINLTCVKVLLFSFLCFVLFWGMMNWEAYTFVGNLKNSAAFFCFLDTIKLQAFYFVLNAVFNHLVDFYLPVIILPKLYVFIKNI